MLTALNLLPEKEEYNYLQSVVEHLFTVLVVLLAGWTAAVQVCWLAGWGMEALGLLFTTLLLVQSLLIRNTKTGALRQPVDYPALGLLVVSALVCALLVANAGMLNNALLYHQCLSEFKAAPHIPLDAIIVSPNGETPFFHTVEFGFFISAEIFGGAAAGVLATVFSVIIAAMIPPAWFLLFHDIGAQRNAAIAAAVLSLAILLVPGNIFGPALNGGLLRGAETIILFGIGLPLYMRCALRLLVHTNRNTIARLAILVLMLGGLSMRSVMLIPILAVAFAVGWMAHGHYSAPRQFQARLKYAADYVRKLGIFILCNAWLLVPALAEIYAKPLPELGAHFTGPQMLLPLWLIKGSTFADNVHIPLLFGLCIIGILGLERHSRAFALGWLLAAMALVMNPWTLIVWYHYRPQESYTAFLAALPTAFLLGVAVLGLYVLLRGSGNVTQVGQEGEQAARSADE